MRILPYIAGGVVLSVIAVACLILTTAGYVSDFEQELEDEEQREYLEEYMQKKEQKKRGKSCSKLQS